MFFYVADLQICYANLKSTSNLVDSLHETNSMSFDLSTKEELLCVREKGKPYPR